MAGIEDVVISIRAGETVVPLPEGASYLGFIFARGESPAAVEEALRRAHARLDFDIAGAPAVCRNVWTRELPARCGWSPAAWRASHRSAAAPHFARESAGVAALARSDWHRT